MIRSNQDYDSMSMDENVAAACRDAGQQVIEIAERTGTDIVIWRDGSLSWSRNRGCPSSRFNTISQSQKTFA